MTELPDDIRVPLHTISADAGYMFGRVAADGAMAAEFTAHLKRLATDLEAGIRRALDSSLTAPTEPGTDPAA